MQLKFFLRLTKLFGSPLTTLFGSKNEKIALKTLFLPCFNVDIRVQRIPQIEYHTNRVDEAMKLLVKRLVRVYEYSQVSLDSLSFVVSCFSIPFVSIFVSLFTSLKASSSLKSCKPTQFSALLYIYNTRGCHPIF
ncbi:unnamed protein product [Kuraishia capsulata CBS 1993]|uniref:Uncharacterized protein n=1 Tax=Kuraishia capsulata CBS 1993 TaxID=1382522 RepID=W6MHJ0_9ASCO|nr:uncharacterized protein KUCA_T00001140001 [Kuraishia capsulata CBS 1993]CDK25173.1 unnamed protein product [Kuraishia capsulata CBS 1993]